MVLMESVRMFVIWVELVLFVSVADSVWSPKILKPVPWEIRHFYSLLQKRVWKSHWKIFGKCRRKYRNSVPAFPTFVLIFFLLFWSRGKCHREKKLDCFFPLVKGIVSYAHVQRIIFAKLYAFCRLGSYRSDKLHHPTYAGAKSLW